MFTFSDAHSVSEGRNPVRRWACRYAGRVQVVALLTGILAVMPTGTARAQCKCCSGEVLDATWTGPGDVLKVRVKWHRDPGDTECDADVEAMAVLKSDVTEETLDTASTPAGVSGCSDAGVVLRLDVPCNLDVTVHTRLRVDMGLGYPDDPLGKCHSSQTLDVIDTLRVPTPPESATPLASDRSFVWENPEPLTCRFRCENDTIEFNIPVTRYVGPTRADGTLEFADELIEKGLAASTVLLEIYAWDVDSAIGELDEVKLNGWRDYETERRLRGASGSWLLSQIEFPLEKVRFPAVPGHSGYAPVARLNTVSISVDADLGAFCTEVAWARLIIKVVSPVVLIHGNDSSPDFFDRQLFTWKLNDSRWLYDNSIEFEPGDDRSIDPTEWPTVPNNARLINGRMRHIARELGVDSLHIVAHSKGGLDARHYLAEHHRVWWGGDIFRVLSFTTLSTPHNGSVGADVLIAEAATANFTAKRDFVGFPWFTGYIAEKLGASIGHEYLTTSYAANFNPDNAGALLKAKTADPALTTHTVFSAFRADADVNLSEDIDMLSEYKRMADESPKLAALPPWKQELAVDRLYQTMRSVAGVDVDYTVSFDGEDWHCVWEIRSVPVPGVPRRNDALVTEDSGVGRGGYAFLISSSGGKREMFSGCDGRNHASIADPGVAGVVLSGLRGIERDHRCGDWASKIDEECIPHENR